MPGPSYFISRPPAPRCTTACIHSPCSKVASQISPPRSSLSIILLSRACQSLPVLVTVSPSAMRLAIICIGPFHGAASNCHASRMAVQYQPPPSCTRISFFPAFSSADTSYSSKYTRLS